MIRAAILEFGPRNRRSSEALPADAFRSLSAHLSLSAGGAGNVATKAGYTFTYAMTTPIAAAPTGCTVAGGYLFTVVATPVTVGTTGQRGFFVDPSGVIRFTTDGSAPTNQSTPLQ